MIINWELRARMLERALKALRDGVDNEHVCCPPLPVTSDWRAIIDYALILEFPGIGQFHGPEDLTVNQ